MPALEQGVSLPDRYRVTRRIASGGMATVYAAEDTLLGRLVAVKVLGPGLASDEAAQRRFQREARTAARVSDHPHVVTVYDIGEHEGQAFIVMEYLPGGTVGDRMRSEDPVPRPAVVQWLADAASALDYAHEAGIVHRDVKPGNLLLDGQGRLGVADFGIARMASDTGMTMTGQVMGTAAYLSPEQALGRSATSASDRYALAAVAFELLTGRKLFPAEHVAAQARAHVEAEPPRPSEVAPGLPAAVDGVLLRGLEKEPDARWPTAGAMVAALEASLGEEAAEATAPTEPVMPRPSPPAAPAAELAAVAVREPAAPASAAPTGRAGREPHARRPNADDRSPEPIPTGAGPRWRPWAATAVVALLIAGAVVAATSGGGSSSSQRAAAPVHPPQARATTPRRTAPARPSTSTSPTSTSAAAPSASGGSGSSADKASLQSQGHALLDQGAYAQAIAVLRQAVAGCPVSNTDPCAYALFDLGRGLVLAGQPSDAIPILEQRLQNPDQTGTVQYWLDRARSSSGGGSSPSTGSSSSDSSPSPSPGPTPPGHDGGPGHGNGHKGAGG